MAQFNPSVVAAHGFGHGLSSAATVLGIEARITIRHCEALVAKQPRMVFRSMCLIANPGCNRMPQIVEMQIVDSGLFHRWTPRRSRLPM